MKTLVAAALLLALAAPADAETCTGRVRIDVVTDNDGLNRKGDRVFNVGGCAFVSSALEKKVLRICPLGSWCRVVGPTAGDTDFESLDSVIKINPYQEGVRDYRKGLCYRARPYPDNSPEQQLWKRGYDGEALRRDARYRHRRYVEWPPDCHAKYEE